MRIPTISASPLSSVQAVCSVGLALLLFSRHIIVSYEFGCPKKIRTHTAIVQLLPHAEHVVVLDETGRISENGSFEALNFIKGGHVNRLGLQKTAIKGTLALTVEEEETEETEKEAALEKIALSEADEASDLVKKSRGKRNSDALVSYMRSMGRISFPVFCVFTFCNVGFRSAQRELFQFSCLCGLATNNRCVLFSALA